MILVTGASGHVGSELVKLLTDQGRSARALVRSPDDTASGVRSGVEVVGGDLNRPESLSEVLEGIDAVFLLGGFADMPGVLAQARAAGVGHVVLLSSRSVVEGHPDNAVVAMHLGSEAAVRESGIEWTLLRPSGFMSNTLQWQAQLRVGDAVRAPFAGVPIAAIDPYDIAAVAAAVLGDKKHFGVAYTLSGPTALLPADQVDILARVLDRPLRFEAQPDDEARKEMLQTTPANYVDAFFRFFAAGEFDDTPVVPTVADLTGRQPRTFEDWATAHAEVFR
ncbi:NAD(P)H-binding protein [Actinoallomurus sp. NPDC050550]|uniref:NAD(P)H-binding protein n=1 Tax=Actinoallomurus sp. NPDC050550 TaxID=3154937 RepID=UPI0033F81E13